MTELALPTAKDWMKPSPFVLYPEVDLFDALRLLVKHRLAAAPVVDPQNRLVGMLTEKDCLRVLSSVAYDGSLDGGTVADFQSQIRVICELGMDVFRVAEQFLATNFPILPVVEDQILRGLISRQDVLRQIDDFRRRLERLAAVRERQAGHQADRPSSIQAMQQTAANQSRDQLVRLFGRKR